MNQTATAVKIEPTERQKAIRITLYQLLEALQDCTDNDRLVVAAAVKILGDGS